MVRGLTGKAPMVLFIVPILGCGVVDCLTAGFLSLVPNPSPNFVVLVGRGTPYDAGVGFLLFLLMLFLVTSLGRD